MTNRLVRTAVTLTVGCVIWTGATSSVVTAQSMTADRGSSRRSSEENVGPSAVVNWNNALLEAIRRTRTAPTFAARALAVAHTCMFDAWAAFDAHARPTISTVPRRPASERTEEAKTIAISYAAYRALSDLFPTRIALFDELMAALQLDPGDQSDDGSRPSGVGNAACAAVLEVRRHDGSNQLGDENGGARYSDYTNYHPVNTSEILLDPNRWQPLRAANGTVQTFLAPYWRHVTPFALESADQFRPSAPAEYPRPRYWRQAEEILSRSAALTDRHKVIAEYWADGPGSETPPGHWNLFAQFVSARDGHSLDDDVRMFFALNNALLDASIAVWDCKVFFDYVRPVSAIRFLYAGRTVNAWRGPGLGSGPIAGEAFQSYIATPPFAEYTSGHSAFSAAAAYILKRFTGSPRLGAMYRALKGSSTIEPGITPSRDIDLEWRTFDEAADEAGLSRRYGGIHFREGDLQSRQMGRQIGAVVWKKALDHFQFTTQRFGS
jgi:hypothetical protein